MTHVENRARLDMMMFRKWHSTKAVRLMRAIEKTTGYCVVILRVAHGNAATLLMSGLSRMLSILFSFLQAMSFLIRFTTYQYTYGSSYTHSFHWIWMYRDSERVSDHLVGNPRLYVTASPFLLTLFGNIFLELLEGRFLVLWDSKVLHR